MNGLPGIRGPMRTLYEILNVEFEASAATIRDAYQKKLQEYQPARISWLDPQSRRVAEDELREVEQAWAVLGNASRRASYDAELGRPSQQSQAFEGAATPPSTDWAWQEPTAAEPTPAGSHRLWDALFYVSVAVAIIGAIMWAVARRR